MLLSPGVVGMLNSSSVFWRVSKSPDVNSYNCFSSSGNLCVIVPISYQQAVNFSQIGTCNILDNLHFIIYISFWTQAQMTKLKDPNSSQ